MSSFNSDIEKLKEFVAVLLPLFRPMRQRRRSNHMGAVVAEVVLQAGLNYRSVVVPRIERIKAEYPHHATVSRMLLLLDEISAAEFLKFNNTRRTTMLSLLLKVFHRFGIETPHDMRDFLDNATFRNDLLSINGMGQKSFDYLWLLVGKERIAIDRHLKRLSGMAGIESRSYSYLQELYEAVGSHFGLPYGYLDEELWLISTRY